MMPGTPDYFGVPLKADPEVALKPLGITSANKAGPLHKVQFVIEFVGPRSMQAASVSRLLDPDWFNALGQPSVYGMRPSDLQWQQLVPSKDGSYDSLALTWDMITPQGTISSAAALQLLQFAERFGPGIQRRSMPLPQPGEVNSIVTQLLEAREALDIGIAVYVEAGGRGFAEKDLWIQCARLGLEYSPEGSFDWRSPNHPMPILSVTPYGATDTFSMGQIQQNAVHQGVTIGFSLPRCIAPTQALEGCFYVGEHFAKTLGGKVLDEDQVALDAGRKTALRVLLKQALGMFSQMGITAGSQEALKLFVD
ncbi:hypothetical protein BH11ARM1_BH11ARM1_11700 [soil metagenome]